MILGFGSNENDFEQQECDFVHAFIARKAAEAGDGMDDSFWFNEEIKTELESALNERCAEYNQLRDTYKTAEKYPSRYSTYSFSILHDIADMCVVMKFSHINRRHAMSPDGWAMLQTKRVHHENRWDHAN